MLLQPFDEVRPVRDTRPVILAPRMLWARLGSRLVSLLTLDGLVAPAAARLDLLPHQLEPALAVAAGGAPRVLLADAVGLGKTVQAGIIVAELFARRQAGRALVLVPAGLRDQWARELNSRFGLDAEVVDAAALRMLAASLPRTVNPWLVPRVAVVSIDFAKRPEVRLGLHEAGWDVVVIDEAHTVGADSVRHHAADLLCRRAAHVVLITATPHDGLDAGFAALAGLGASTPREPLVMFRRSRRDAGLDAPRRQRLLRVRLGTAGSDAQRTLLAYLRRVWASRASTADPGARLAAIFLLKRALSSPAALLRSIQRRRALLAGLDDPQPRQLALPLDDDLEAGDEAACAGLGAPGLDDGALELAWLDRIAAAAERAARDHGKLRALARLTRRVAEPAIVFTEYRDTLDEVAARLGRTRRCVTLHGGLDRAARGEALRVFDSGRADILLATDAAGAGLNLHERCRLVVNLELPWSPVRLEQRIGRVDRIGQTQTVHAICLVGRSTPEERILARLVARAERARRTLGDATGVGWPAWSEAETAELLLGREPMPRMLASAGQAAVPSVVERHPPPPPIERPDLVDAARAETRRIHGLRLVRQAIDRPGPARVPGACTRHDARTGAKRSNPPAGTSLEADRVVSLTTSVARPSSRTDSEVGCTHAAPLVSFARPRPTTRTSAANPGNDPLAASAVLAVFEVTAVDGRGRVVGETLVPVHASGRVERPASRPDARRLAASLVAVLPAIAKPLLADEARHLVRRAQARADSMRSRSRSPLEDSTIGPGAGSRLPIQPPRAGPESVSCGARAAPGSRPVQRGLFDRRAERSRGSVSQEPLPTASDGHGVMATPPRLRFVLVRTI